VGAGGVGVGVGVGVGGTYTYGTVFNSVVTLATGSGSMMTVSVSRLRLAMMPEVPCVHGRERNRLSSGP
jgi:hypothetical protein